MTYFERALPSINKDIVVFNFKIFKKILIFRKLIRNFEKLSYK